MSVPYVTCKIDELEIINCGGNDNANFLVCDDDSGTYSGYAGAILNQFGFNVCVSDLFYADSSNYDAELHYGMVIKVEYINNDTESKNIGINAVLHEVVSE